MRSCIFICIFIYENLNLKECNDDEKRTIKEQCENFPFEVNIQGDPLGYTYVLEHTIDLIPGSKVVNIRQYRIPQTLKRIMEDIVKDFEKMGAIEKCNSKWNSPAILVSKKDTHKVKKDNRFVVDYRKVNEFSLCPD